MNKQKMEQRIASARREGLACVVEDEILRRREFGFGTFFSRRRELTGKPPVHRFIPRVFTAPFMSAPAFEDLSFTELNDIDYEECQ